MLILFPSVPQITANDLSKYYVERDGNCREFGWWLQQVIKLGVPTAVANLSSPYIVWDADLFPTTPWPLYSNGEYKFAILQGEARSSFNDNEYNACMLAITGLEPATPVGGGTFICHHM